MINIEKVNKKFDEYVSNFNVEQGRIKLKIEHIKRVAKISTQIAQYLDLNKDNTEIFNELKSTITELNKNKELYAKNYGPLCLKDNVNYNSYMWSKNPWPWMNTGGNYNV